MQFGPRDNVVTKADIEHIFMSLLFQERDVILSEIMVIALWELNPVPHDFSDMLFVCMVSAWYFSANGE